MYKVGVKFCGNCNPHIDGPGLMEKLKSSMPGVTFCPYSEPQITALLIISGCPADCATRPSCMEPAIIVAGYTLDGIGCEKNGFAETIKKKLNKRINYELEENMMKIREVVIASACRTAIGKFMGGLSSVPARELAITAGKAAIERAGIAAGSIDEIVMGQLYTAMQGSLPARQVAMRIGFNQHSGAVSVNQNCASGMRAMEIACHNIMLGKTDISLVIGVESMTNAPYVLPKARMGYRMGQGVIEDSMIFDGLNDELVPGHMGLTAENIAEQYGITRQECDELALMSHNRAAKAIENGIFKREIVPLEISSKKGTIIFDTDEHPIRNASLESMSKVPPAFKKDGVVTAANASGINDGAAAAVVMSKEKARELGVKPLMKLINICTEGVDPKLMGLGPAVAIPKCLKQSGLQYEDIEYWEINEAFAAQWLGVGRMLKEDYGLKIDLNKVNHNGSGIALGHPVGCTGLRIIVSLYYEMERLGLTVGGASLCVGGGPAMASLWTRDI